MADRPDQHRLDRTPTASESPRLDYPNQAIEDFLQQPAKRRMGLDLRLSEMSSALTSMHIAKAILLDLATNGYQVTKKA